MLKAKLLGLALLLSTACGGELRDTQLPGKGYLMVQIGQIQDVNKFFNDYANIAGPVVNAYARQLMVASAQPIRYEGAAPDGWTVMIQYDSPQTVQSWYNDPVYQTAIPIRQAAVDRTDMTIFKGRFGTGEDFSGVGAYLLEQVLEVSNWAKLSEYRIKSERAMARYGGRVIIEGAPRRLLEGQWPARKTRLVTFPSRQDMDDWMTSAEYQSLQSLRNQASTVMSVAGFEQFVPPPPPPM